MKFFCDNCQAQYMISDEKVGPAGVRVRCKKCGHVIYVKRLDEDLPEDMTVVMPADTMAALGAAAIPEPSQASAMLLPSGDEQLDDGVAPPAAGGEEGFPAHGAPSSDAGATGHPGASGPPAWDAPQHGSSGHPEGSSHSAARASGAGASAEGSDGDHLSETGAFNALQSSSAPVADSPADSAEGPPSGSLGGFSSSSPSGSEDRTSHASPASLAPFAAEPDTGPALVVPTRPSSPGLEEEIGQALDSMFSDGPTTASPAPTPSGPSKMPVVLGASPKSQVQVAGFSAIAAGRFTADDDRAETRVITTDDMEKIAADMSAAPQTRASNGAAANGGSPGGGTKVAEPETDWFIAVRDEQVGPLRVNDIRERFERGEVGGDTLVWSTGLTDWRPLSSVDELAELIIPKKEITRSRSQILSPAEVAKELAPKKEAPVTFKPSAASALASLASMAKEEIAASSKSTLIEPAPRSQFGGQVASPFGGAPAPAASDPRGLSTDMLAGLPSPSPDVAPAPQAPAPYTPSYQNGHTSSPAAGVPDYRESPLAQRRPRRSGAGLSPKLVGAIAGAVLLLIALIVASIYFLAIKPQHELAAQIAEQQRREQELRIKADAEAAARAQQAAQAAQAALAAKPAPAPAPSPAPQTAPASAPSAPQGVAQTHAAASEPAGRGERRGSGKRHGGKESAEASPATQGSAPTPAATPAPAAKGGDDFLGAAGGGDVDKEFARELDSASGESGKSTKHAPYIPPPPGQGDLPASLSQSDIVGAVTQHRDSFAKCVQDQKRRDPNTSGTVVMRWKIKPDGRSTDIGAKGEEYADSPLAGCFKSQIGKLKFGAYKGPQMAPIEFPFSF